MLFNFRRTLGGVLISGFFAGLFYVAPASVSAQECDAECHQLLAQTRAATARFQREAAAVAAGYVPDPVCVALPDGSAAMGTHYVNRPLVQAPGVDPTAPEVLLYATMKNGKKKLIGVEYLVPVIVNGEPWFGPGDPPAGQYNPAPVLYGQTFDGPMPGHNPFMPWHYDLHVWLWQHNPDGMFAQFNTTVQCPE